MADFEDAVTDIMYRIEGISHFTIEHFYTFEYLSNYDQLLSPSIDELIEQWYTTLTGYNAQLIDQLNLSEVSQAAAIKANSELSFSTYVNDRVSDLKRIGSTTPNQLFLFSMTSLAVVWWNLTNN